MKKIILSELSLIIKDISGIDTATADTDASFLTMGLDSLMIVRMSQKIQNRFGIELKISQFYEEVSSLNKLVDYIVESEVRSQKSEDRSQKSEVRSQKSEDKNSSFFIPNPSFSNSSMIERIMLQQMQAMSNLMSQQLEMLGGIQKSGVRIQKSESRSQKINNSQEPRANTQEPTPNTQELRANSQQPTAINLRAMKLEPDLLTPQQQDFLNKFIPRYVERTKKSKELTRKYRQVLSDWIASLGFRLTLKELKYPITASRSSGSKIWDIDGNEYIDIAIGYGVSFFGNRAPFITKAIEEQLYEGFELGPQTPLAGEVAELISELAGVERVAFCNTGSEAVMFALRIARTVTGKRKIVIFNGSYHGISDSVMATPGENETDSQPAAPGVPQGMVEDLIILPYGISKSLEIINDYADELAAVLVEPVQSRRPGFQPKEFLNELREITLQHDIPLIFDEMITGFRICPGGAQAHFKVQADLVTYGKIIGGGMPIGVVAGKAEYMDTVDGGMWQFGDESYPSKQVTAFAGTFCKHPLSMASARAALRYMKEKGPQLQEQVNARTAYLANTLNDFFEKENVPIRVEHFGSLFRFESFGKYHLLLEPIEMNLFFYLLLEKGVYTWERHICFLSVAHTDEDVESVLHTVKESIKEMKQGGFWNKSQPTSRQPTTNSYPLSSAQARLFFLDQLDGVRNSYRITGALRINGKLDFDRLERAFAELVKRNDILRTSFEMRDGELIQQVHNNIDFHIHKVDENEKDIDELIQNFIQPFDLKNPPLFRVSLAKLSEDSYLLMIDAHHIALDGLSMSIIMKEISILYEGKSLLPMTKQYRDFVKWQQAHLQTDAIKEDEAYWLKKFSEEIPVLNLPLDFSRPMKSSSKGDILYSCLSKERTAQLNRFAKEKNVTLSMVLLAAYNVMLHRLTQQEDIIVGMPVSGRPAGFENVIGMFANTIAIRNYPKGEETFKTFLNKVKINALKDYDHQDYPFELLVNKLNLERDISRNALFDTMFTYEQADEREFRIKELTFAPYEIKVDTAMFDLDLEAIEQKGIIYLSMAYSTDIFRRDTIERYLGYYEKIIQEIIKNPNQRLADIDILSKAEKDRLLIEFNDTQADFPEHKTIIDLFEEQVAQTPNKTAVIFPTSPLTSYPSPLAPHLSPLTSYPSSSTDIRLTYSELDEQSSQVASCLRQKYQIQPEDRVGLLLNRSELMVIGALGIMKAGGVCVPIDAMYPSDRIRYILQDSNCKLILTEGLCNIPKEIDIPVLDIREIANFKFQISNFKFQISNQNLAYIIYTSGSTGLPKGVMVEHKNLINLAYAYHKAYIPKDFEIRLLQLASISFDVFFGDILRTLISGGEMIICPSETRTDLAALYNLIATYHINIFESTPALILPLMDYIYENKLDIRFLKILVIGSDMLQTRHYKKLLDRFGKTGMRIINSFGITETTIDSSYFEIQGVEDSDLHKKEPKQNLSGAITPIASPLLQNTQFYILDNYQNLQPIGVTGELYIGGAGVARGYLNNESLTRERFIPNPLNPKERLYKTGDIARWLSNGDVEFFGRIDNQVQIRGYRIETEEIEKQLLKHDAIKEAVVLAREAEDGSKELVAYVVCINESLLPEFTSNLRRYLSWFLPDYMIPAYFIFLKKIPLTPNAKIDKNALPLPERKNAGLNTEYIAPRNDTEKKFVRIWENILNRKPISIYDNFFELGGHSIKAIRLVSKIQTELGLAIRLQDIFRTPNIAELSAKAIPSRMKPIEPLPKRPYYDLSNAQKRLWLIDQIEENRVIYNMHLAYHVEGELNADALEKAIQSMINRHESFRTVFISVEGEPKQKILDDIDFKLERVDLSHEENPEEIALAYYREEADTLFDLEKGPLFRAKLIQISNFKFQISNRYILIFNIHHIIFDGWTHDIMLKEISALYRYYRTGESPNLLQLQIHYKDYAAWLNTLLKDDLMKPHRDYWVNRFSGKLPVLDFPLDFPRPLVQRFNGKYAKFSIDHTLTERLYTLSRDYGVTLFTMLVCAVDMLLYSYTLQEDVVVGFPTAGRIHPNLENQVGFYLNMLPLRIRFNSNDSFEMLLEKVKQSSVEAYEHEMYPYDALIEALHLPKDSSRNHLFDIIVNIVNFERPSLELDNLRITSFAEESMTSRADMTFIFESDDKSLLNLTIEYDTDLFKPDTIQKIGDRMMMIFNLFSNNMKMTLTDAKALFVTHEEKEEQDAFLKSTLDIEEVF